MTIADTDMPNLSAMHNYFPLTSSLDSPSTTQKYALTFRCAVPESVNSASTDSEILNACIDEIFLTSQDSYSGIVDLTPFLDSRMMPHTIPAGLQEWALVPIEPTPLFDSSSWKDRSINSIFSLE
jgi:hypothetical protein